MAIADWNSPLHFHPPFCNLLYQRLVILIAVHAEITVYSFLNFQIFCHVYFQLHVFFVYWKWIWMARLSLKQLKTEWSGSNACSENTFCRRWHTSWCVSALKYILYSIFIGQIIFVSKKPVILDLGACFSNKDLFDAGIIWGKSKANYNNKNCFIIK